MVRLPEYAIHVSVFVGCADSSPAGGPHLPLRRHLPQGEGWGKMFFAQRSVWGALRGFVLINYFL